VAFEDTASRHNLPHLSLHTDNNSFDFEAYERLLDQLFREQPEVDGIFAGSDIIAACALKACQVRGRRVPEDVRIIGYDGIALRSLLYPNISTIRQPVEEMGKLAVELILKQVQGETVAAENILPVELEEGTST
jgi:LacI family sucrose operon transcriptional repressor